MTQDALEVEIWADVVCPWCYIGKARFDQALAEFPFRDHVNVTLRSFELDPTPRKAEMADTATRLATKYGMSPQQAQEAVDRVRAVAAEAGIAMTEGDQFHGNTRDAHRLVHFAMERGRGAELSRALYDAHFTRRQSVFDHGVLADLAAEAGLDRDEAQDVLASGRYDDDVVADEELAASFGISGVPFFVFDRRIGVSGAQPLDVMTAALQEAWGER